MNQIRLYLSLLIDRKLPNRSKEVELTMQRNAPRDVIVSRHSDMAHAFQLFSRAMSDFIDNRMGSYLQSSQWTQQAAQKLGRPLEHGAADPYFQLLVLQRFWGPVFSDFYGEDLRSIIQALIVMRNNWAHFALADDVNELDQAVVMMERLVAQVDFDAAIEIRGIRPRLKNPKHIEMPEDLETELSELQAQLEQTKSIVDSIETERSQLQDQLGQTRKISADKQLRLSSLENQLVTIREKSQALELHLEQQKAQQNRLEWLAIGFIVVLMLVLVVGFQ